MSSLMRWDPVREMTSLREAMDQLVEQAVLRPGSGGRAFGGSAFGAMNVFEVGNRYLCQVLLPGVAGTDIDLTVRQNTLTVKAALADLLPEEARTHAAVLLREFGPGEFTRSIAFPKDVDGDAVQAQLEQGVLSIAIPLAQHAQPRRIQITEASGTTPTPRAGESSSRAATADSRASVSAETPERVVDEHAPDSQPMGAVNHA